MGMCEFHNGVNKNEWKRMKMNENEFEGMEMAETEMK